MATAFPEITIGEPIWQNGLSVYPLFTDSRSDVSYRLANEAIADQQVTVKEVSKSGSVSQLLVENLSDSRILLLEGEQLVGAKQNRILNTSILLGAKSSLRVPVSCVERGRWSYTSELFDSSDSHAPAALRHGLKGAVSASATRGLGHRSDQGEVWNHVDDMLSSLRIGSSTSAMSDAFSAYEADVSDCVQQIEYVQGASGVAVAVGGRVVGFDIFDKPETCRKVWRRLLSGCVLQSLASPQVDERTSADDVRRLIEASEQADWQSVDAVGEGDERRAQVGCDHASTLFFEGTLLHGSVMARQVSPC